MCVVVQDLDLSKVPSRPPHPRNPPSLLADHVWPAHGAEYTRCAWVSPPRTSDIAEPRYRGRLRVRSVVWMVSSSVDARPGGHTNCARPRAPGCELVCPQSNGSHDVEVSLPARETCGPLAMGPFARISSDPPPLSPVSSSTTVRSGSQQLSSSPPTRPRSRWDDQLWQTR